MGLESVLGLTSEMRILFVHQSLTSFVEKDLRILEEAHEVRECHFRGVGDIPGILVGVLWCDATYSWFGKLHAFFAVLLSKVLRKKSAVVAGGDDVAKVPELKYGLFCSWWKRYCALFVFRFADLILCVSQDNKAETLVNARADPRRVRLVYHGFDGGAFRKLRDVAKEDVVLTVGRVTEETLAIKGLEVFVGSASLVPENQFLVVGPGQGCALDRLKGKAAGNVAFCGGMYGDDLVKILSRAKVYVQASVHESFGCALAEAMLCECVPVVSRRGAIPEVVGQCGLYVDKVDPGELAARIREALASDMGIGARQRVLDLFPLERRRRELLEAMNSLG